MGIILPINVNNGNIDTILTRNIKDFKNSEIGALTPEDYLKTKK